MKKKSFREMDSLDKFLTIYMRLLDNSIESLTDAFFRDLYVKERKLILSVVDFIRAIDEYSDEELIHQLKAFDEDSKLKQFIAILVSQYDYSKEPLDNTTKYFGKKIKSKKEDIKHVKDKN